MRIYHYEPETRAYTGNSSEADESPLEPGVFLIPANATEAEPPYVPQGQRAIFEGESWVLDYIPLPPRPPLKERWKTAPKSLFGSRTMKQVFGDMT